MSQQQKTIINLTRLFGSSALVLSIIGQQAYAQQIPPPPPQYYCDSTKIIADWDSDGIIDDIDIDDDNDSIPDSWEDAGIIDQDGDGIPNSCDLDSDGDGIYDLIESETGNHTSGFDSDQNGQLDPGLQVGSNGLLDDIETTPDSGLVDRDQNGAAESPPAIDTDKDTIPDYLDRDSDNDSALDATESDGSATNPPDSDGDTIPNFRDLDSDNDGIPDYREVNGIMNNTAFRINPITDNDGDGLHDHVATNPSPVPDSELDGIPDYLDLDSDNSETNDVWEAGGIDNNADNRIDGFTDDNKDGYHDPLETSPLPVPDEDSDGIEDFREPTLRRIECTPLPCDPAPRTPTQGTVKTGLNGVGGCTVNPNAGFDPMLPTMLAIIALYFMRQRYNKHKAAMSPTTSSFTTGKTSLYLVTASTAAITFAIAQPVDAGMKTEPTPWYIGLGIGMSQLEPDTSDTNYSLDDTKDFGWRVFLGKDVREKLSIEAYYSDQGEMTLSPTGKIGYRDLGISGLYTFKEHAFNTPGLDLFAKAGLGFMKNDSNVDYQRENDQHILFGAGLKYPLNEFYTLRADLDLYDKDSQLFTISIARYFGKTTQPVSQAPIIKQPPEPEILVQLEQPKEPEQPPEVTPTSKRNEDCLKAIMAGALSAEGCMITLENVNFEFDSVALKDQAQKILTDVAQKLRPGKKYKLMVSGHTDAIGTREYNVDLSLGRADSVKDYLVEKGVSSWAISTKGHAFDEPIADNNTHEGRAQNRRVELNIIEVID